jgi:hypothetical protein
MVPGMLQELEATAPHPAPERQQSLQMMTVM